MCIITSYSASQETTGKPCTEEEEDVPEHGGVSNPNLRYLLRAYEGSDCVRAATAIAGDDLVTRDELRTRWATRWPRHAEQTGIRRISARLNNALGVMAAAGIIERDGDTVRVVDRPKLEMAARNAEIVLDADGDRPVIPSAWARRPKAPAELHHVQAALEENRTASATAPGSSPWRYPSPVVMRYVKETQRLPDDPASRMAMLLEFSSTVAAEPGAATAANVDAAEALLRALRERAVDDLVDGLEQSGGREPS